jgi:hypothetical protein
VTRKQDFNNIELIETTQAILDPLIWENPMGEARKDALRLFKWGIPVDLP